MTVSEFKKNTIAQFQESQSTANQTPSLDTEVLLCHALNFTKTQLLLNQNTELPPEKSAWLQQAVHQRLTGMPIAYITGHKEFFGLDFVVSPDVLIPKPDTEILVENAIPEIKEKILSHPNSIITVCDMCTGSGCIGISVLNALSQDSEIPQDRLPLFTFVDISKAALDTARLNAEKLLPKQLLSNNRIRFILSNLFGQVPQTFDIILTNPPYIPASMVTELLQDGRNEPRLALDGDIDQFGNNSGTSDGLDIIRRLIIQASQKLDNGGVIFMEAGEYNIIQAQQFALTQGYKKSQILKDLADQDRILILE